jgi:GDP-L-fucose synthase
MATKTCKYCEFTYEQTDPSEGRHLVLGASGFIGKNLFECFSNRGYDVSGTRVDLTDYLKARTLISGKDYVWMLAAKTFGLGVLVDKPDSLVRENIIMNANVLQACYECGVKKVLMVSSSVVYQDSDKCLNEEDLDLNQQPYHLYQGVGWVKRYTEQLARFYNTLGLNVITVRPTGVYGKYDKLDITKSHVIPALIQKFLSGSDTVEIWGLGSNIKDFVYIDDFIRDIVGLMEVYNSPEPLNICSGELHSIKEIAEIIAEITGFKGDIVYNLDKPETISIKHISNEKIRQILNNDYLPLRDGLAKTIEWIKNDIASKR